MSPEVGSVVGGKYRLFKPLARGGMGAIWVARHTELDVSVAIKLIAPELVASDTAVNRFRHEARAAAQLRSPHVVQILDYGVDDGLPYMAMELLSGEDLGALIEREGRLGAERVLGLLRPVCKALKLAHDARIVHRDLKPANIFVAKVGDDEVVKVLDFGIAKALGGDGSLNHTASDTLVGSPLYMSPEQSRGDPVDARSDLWSLSVVAFEALVGRPPFEGRGLGDVFAQICQAPAPKPSELGVKLPGLDAFFARALAKAPGDRHASVSEWLAELESCLAGARTSYAVAAGTGEAALSGEVPSPPSEARTATLVDSRDVAEPATRDAGGEPSEGRRGSKALLVAASLLAVAAAATFAWFRQNTDAAPATTTESAPAAAPAIEQPPATHPIGVSATGPDVSPSSAARDASHGVEPRALTAPSAASTLASARPDVAPPGTARPPAPAANPGAQPSPPRTATAGASAAPAPKPSAKAPSTTDPDFGI